MKRSALLVFVSLACASTASYATGAVCAAPQFPSYSTSDREVRQVAREVKHYRACQDAAAPTANTAEIKLRSADVEARLEAWLASTIDYSQAQRNGQRRLSFVDIDRVERGQAPRAQPRAVRRAPHHIVKANPAPAS